MFKSLLAKKASVLALGLASVGLVSASNVSPSTTFTGTITLTHNEFNNYFVYSANGGAITGAQGVGGTNPFTGQSNFVPAGTFPASESIPQYISSGVATALGMYSSTGVSVAVTPAVYNSAVNTESWSQVFPGTSEASIATALANGDQATLLSFLNTYSSDFVSFTSNSATPITADILDFSNALPGGSLTFANITAVGNPGSGNPGSGNPGSGNPGSGPSSATPEPSTQLLLVAGVTVVAFAARKFRRA